MKAEIREMCGLTKRVDERISHIERKGNDRISKRVDVGECAVWPLRVVLCLKIGDLL